MTQKMKKMKPAMKKKWTAALRSGEYSQTIENLQDERGYCCLGVLCDVIQKQWSPAGDLLENDESELDKATLNFCQLDSSTQRKLVNFNDERRWNFDKIADYIDRYL